MSNETPASEEQPVLEYRRDQWVHLVLNRPARLNALTEPMLIMLAERLEAAAGDPAVRAVLISGAGKAFCAGQDLNARDPRKHAGPFDLEAIQKRLFHPVVRRMRTMDKPVVAAVSGVAAGAGAAIALAADIVLAGNAARFIMSFVKVGLSADAGAGFALTRTLGPARARGLLMTGGEIDGTEAAAAGLIWRSVADGTLIAEAEALTAALAAGPTTAHAAIKQAVAAAETCDFDAYLAIEAALQGKAGASADYREGVLAFLERRPERFVGH